MIAPPSPCTGVCQIAPDSGLCIGCARNLDEIARWARLDAREKQAVVDDLPRRRP